jgi:hypothetical protein
MSDVEYASRFNTTALAAWSVVLTATSSGAGSLTSEIRGAFADAICSNVREAHARSLAHSLAGFAASFAADGGELKSPPPGPTIVQLADVAASARGRDNVRAALRQVILAVPAGAIVDKSRSAALIGVILGSPTSPTLQKPVGPSDQDLLAADTSSLTTEQLQRRKLLLELRRAEDLAAAPPKNRAKSPLNGTSALHTARCSVFSGGPPRPLNAFAPEISRLAGASFASGVDLDPAIAAKLTVVSPLDRGQACAAMLQYLRIATCVVHDRARALTPSLPLGLPPSPSAAVAAAPGSPSSSSAAVIAAVRDLLQQIDMLRSIADWLDRLVALFFAGPNAGHCLAQAFNTAVHTLNASGLERGRPFIDAAYVASAELQASNSRLLANPRPQSSLKSSPRAKGGGGRPPPPRSPRASNRASPSRRRPPPRHRGRSRSRSPRRERRGAPPPRRDGSPSAGFASQVSEFMAAEVSPSEKICFAFNSTRGCSKSASACPFDHVCCFPRCRRPHAATERRKSCDPPERF